MSESSAGGAKTAASAPPADPDEARRGLKALDAVDAGYALFGPGGLLIRASPAQRRSRRPGVTQQELLRHTAGRGILREAVGREDEWIEERMRDSLAGQVDRELTLCDGRAQRVVELVTPRWRPCGAADR